MSAGTILIADDHPLFRQALRLAVERVLPDYAIVEAGSLAAAAAHAAAVKDLRLILLDLKMPGAVGYSGIALLHAECPDVPILVVSSAEGSAAEYLEAAPLVLCPGNEAYWAWPGLGRDFYRETSLGLSGVDPD